MINHTKQRGTAIIVALFITALVAAAAIAMIDRMRIDTRRTELLLNDSHANFYAQGSINWAIDQLVNNWKQPQAGHVIDKTPLKSPVNEINGAKIYSIIYDAQANFNLNNLTNSPYQASFTHLLQILAPGTEPAILQGIVDWITPGKTNSPFDEYYAKLHPPYRAPHRIMSSVSELRLVKGMTPQLYALLSPYLTALPETTTIDINSAPLPVLMSLSPTMSLEAAKGIDARRKQAPFLNLQDFQNFDIVKNNPLAPGTDQQITATSTYFLLETNVIIGEQHLTLYTLLQRLTKNSKPLVIVVWQSKGTL